VHIAPSDFNSTTADTPALWGSSQRNLASAELAEKFSEPLGDKIDVRRGDVHRSRVCRVARLARFAIAASTGHNSSSRHAQAQSAFA
jgi:hypothetical protein